MLGQVLNELQQLKAHSGYAALIPMFTILGSVTRKDLESAGAFRKEVDYAKQLASLGSPNNQMRFYKANILATKDDEKTDCELGA